LRTRARCALLWYLAVLSRTHATFGSALWEGGGGTIVAADGAAGEGLGALVAAGGFSH